MRWPTGFSLPFTAYLSETSGNTPTHTGRPLWAPGTPPSLQAPAETPPQRSAPPEITPTNQPFPRLSRTLQRVRYSKTFRPMLRALAVTPREFSRNISSCLLTPPGIVRALGAATPPGHGVSSFRRSLGQFLLKPVDSSELPSKPLLTFLTSSASARPLAARLSLPVGSETLAPGHRQLFSRPQLSEGQVSRRRDRKREFNSLLMSGGHPTPKTVSLHEKTRMGLCLPHEHPPFLKAMGEQRRLFAAFLSDDSTELQKAAFPLSLSLSPLSLIAKMGVAQNLTGGVTQALVHASIYRGPILVPVF